MGEREYLQVDPATLHLPGGRRDGVDPVKLHRQMARHGLSIEGMPSIEVSRGIDGELVINDARNASDSSDEVSSGDARAGGSHRPIASSGRWITHGEGAAMTTETSRAELLEALSELGRLHPNWRMGQMLANLAMAAGRLEAGGVWDLEDDEALAAARELLNQRAGTSVANA